MSGFYKMDPAAWDFGTAGLSLEEEAAYLRIVNAIHKHDGPVPNIDRVLAGMFRCSTRKARALVAALVKARKLVIEGGAIWNERARSDMVHRQLVSVSRVEMGAKGGRVRAENAAKALGLNGSSQPIASSRIEENRREEKKEPPLPPKRGADKSDADAVDILAGVMPRETAEAYAAHRRAKRAKLTKRAAELVAKALFGHPSPVAVVEASIANGWTGVFPERWRPPRDGPEERPRFDVAAVLRDLNAAERKVS